MKFGYSNYQLPPNALVDLKRFLCKVNPEGSSQLVEFNFDVMEE